MTSRDFAYWLQGFFEIAKPEALTTEQTKMIKAHLNLVFKHEIDPSFGDQKYQNELNKIHNEGIHHEGTLRPNFHRDENVRC